MKSSSVITDNVWAALTLVSLQRRLKRNASHPEYEKLSKEVSELVENYKHNENLLCDYFELVKKIDAMDNAGVNRLNRVAEPAVFL